MSISDCTLERLHSYEYATGKHHDPYTRSLRVRNTRASGFDLVVSSHSFLSFYFGFGGGKLTHKQTTSANQPDNQVLDKQQTKRRNLLLSLFLTAKGTKDQRGAFEWWGYPTP